MKNSVSKLYDDINKIIDDKKMKKNIIRYIFRKVNLCLYVLFIFIGIKVFNINMFYTLIGSGIGSYILMLFIKNIIYNMIDKRYKIEEDRINLLINIVDNKNTKVKSIEKKERYNYEYNPYYKDVFYDEQVDIKKRVRKKDIDI